MPLLIIFGKQIPPHLPLEPTVRSNMKFSNTAVAFFAIMKGVVGDFSFRVDYLPVGSVRTDAIVQKDCLSDHVHTFYGPQLLRPEVEYEDLVKSDIQINSGNVVENK